MIYRPEEFEDPDEFTAKNMRRKSAQAADRLIPEVVKSSIIAATNKGLFTCTVRTKDVVARLDHQGIDTDIAPYQFRVDCLVTKLSRLGFTISTCGKQVLESNGTSKYPAEIQIKW